MSFVLLDVLSILGQLPASTTLILILCVSGITILALINESACDRLIRVLKVLLGRSDNTPRHKRR